MVEKPTNAKVTTILMKTKTLLLAILLFVHALTAEPLRSDSLATARDPVGLWCAKRHFGPELKGDLAIQHRGDYWIAEIGGVTEFVTVSDNQISFEISGEQGGFRGRFTGDQIIGHWIQPHTVVNGCRYATPVILSQQGPNRWLGEVSPLDDHMTFYLPVKRNEDGSFATFLRNPERNSGRFMRVDRISLDTNKVSLFGRRSSDQPEELLMVGSFNTEHEMFSLSLPWRGGTYDFHRASEFEELGFYPRSKSPAPYTYHAPPLLDDGWPVANLADVGISRDTIAKFVEMLIKMPIESVQTSDIHALLIARHGKLVLEEYFHRYSRDQLHDTRSASKSMTSALFGAAMLDNQTISISTGVFEVMDGASALIHLDPRKQVLKVEHLLTMSSGLDCDDSNSDSRGNEDTMQEQAVQPDWYRYTLDLDMVRNPGEKAVYGSANPNLLGGVLAKTTGRWLPDLFRELIAEPLQIRNYALNLTPTGDAYMGGGGHFTLRDFMKLGQMILDDGKWQGRQIVSAEYARRSTSALVEIEGHGYGYLWWVVEYPFRGRTIRAFFAGGNGGQLVLGIPELDLLIGFYGGNYSDRAGLIPQQEYIPKYILPSIESPVE